MDIILWLGDYAGYFINKGKISTKEPSEEQKKKKKEETLTSAQRVWVIKKTKKYLKYSGSKNDGDLNKGAQLTPTGKAKRR